MQQTITMRKRILGKKIKNIFTIDAGYDNVPVEIIVVLPSSKKPQDDIISMKPLQEKYMEEIRKDEPDLYS